MKMRTLIVAAILVLCAGAIACAAEPELADQIEYGYENLNTPPNQQKFLSILFFVVLGGMATYAVLRGIKKIVHAD